MPPRNTRRCTLCFETKPLIEFTKSQRGRCGGRPSRGRCMRCVENYAIYNQSIFFIGEGEDYLVETQKRYFSSSSDQSEREQRCT